MKIAIACDHVAVEMKKEIISYLDSKEIEYVDFGTHDSTRTDYPIYGELVGIKVSSGEFDKGILICGTGVGISLAANKVPGVRAVVCSEPYTAKLSRLHNDTNILAFGARVIGVDLAKMILEQWLFTEFEGGRHQKRVTMLSEIEERQMNKKGEK